jgi:hypothetical protein
VLNSQRSYLHTFVIVFKISYLFKVNDRLSMITFPVVHSQCAYPPVANIQTKILNSNVHLTQDGFALLSPVFEGQLSSVHMFLFPQCLDCVLFSFIHGMDCVLVISCFPNNLLLCFGHHLSDLLPKGFAAVRGDTAAEM